MYGEGRRCINKMLEFSKLIIDTIKDLEGPLWPFVQDYACGGQKRRISLFRDRNKSLEDRYAQVDMFSPFAGRFVGLLLEDDSQEKGALSPRAALGRGMCPVLSNYVIDRASPPLILPIRRAVLIQCVDLERVSIRSRKLQQFRNVEEDINGLLGNRCGSVADYFLIAGTYREFRSGAAGERLRSAVKLAIDRFLTEVQAEGAA